MADNSGNVQGVEDLDDGYIGPTYKYHSKIKSPLEMGLSPESGIGDNLGGMFSYIEVLISGDSDATNWSQIEASKSDGRLKSARNGPLGAKFFIKTGGKCDIQQPDNGQLSSEGLSLDEVDFEESGQGVSAEKVDRSVYINNIPDGNLPLLGKLMKGPSIFKGLIPGVLSNISNMNPLALFNAFTNSTTCQKITLPTVDDMDIRKNETRYMLTSDIKQINPCWFPCDSVGNRTNTITKGQCSINCANDPEYKKIGWKEPIEGFKNMNITDISEMPDDIIIQIYFISLALLMIYIVFKMCKKK